MGTTTTPYYIECSLLDRVAGGAKPGLPTEPAALEILERVASGRMDNAKSDLEELVGLRPGQLRGSVFKDPMVRSHALRDIGDLELPEALEYLQNLKIEDLPPDTSQQVWQAAQIALRQGLINRIPDEPGKVRILEDAIVSWNRAAGWAVQQLCDRGSSGSLSIIEAYYRKGYSEPRASQFYGLCKAQIEILSRNPDRVVALGSTLTLANGFGNRELIGWTINQLAQIKSPQAYAELERYMNEINALPDASPSKDRGIRYAQRIREVLAERPPTGGRR